MFRPARALTCAVLTASLLLGAAGCGGGSDDASGKASSSASAKESLTQAEKSLDALRKRIVAKGVGSFTQTTADSGGGTVSTLAGRYDLDSEQVRATLTLPDGLGKGKPASATIVETGGKAWVRTNQFPAKVRSCFLTTTPQQLLSDFGVDVASVGDSVPLALRLLNAFDPGTSSGGGVIQGSLPLQETLPLLSGPLLAQILQAKPKGTVAASMGIDGDEVDVSVNGFSLVGPLSAALGVDETQLASYQKLRFDASLTPLQGAFRPVAAPAKDRQMTAAQLKQGRCG